MIARVNHLLRLSLNKNLKLANLEKSRVAGFFYALLALNRHYQLLALTQEDFDFTNNTVKINKSYQRLRGEDYITSPKTPKSNRTIKMPKFLVAEIQEYKSTRRI